MPRPPFARHALLAAILASLFWLSSSAASAEEARHDYPINGGHFYRQAAGESGRDGFGYRIVDDDGVPFWSEFQRLGGVDALGYPISRRFYLDGFVCQATQRAILQWHPERGEVRLINIMDYLSRLGVDDMLAERRFVPRPNWNAAPEHRQAWLELDPRIRTVYFGAPDPVALFGLPLSPPEEIGPAVAMRFQRGVIYAWKVPQAWAGEDQVSVANVGDFVKEARGIPALALEPEPAPPAREVVQSSRGGARPGARQVGVATYYAHAFHGLTMANGERFDMWNPTTTASNTHPLGTWLRVTRVDTGQSVVVRVTDRGAFRYPIIVDLSYAAFRQLANPSQGVIRVFVDPVD